MIPFHRYIARRKNCVDTNALGDGQGEGIPGFNAAYLKG